MTQETFAENAPTLRRAGWAVLPSAGKSPMVSGFNKMRYAPGEQQVERWAAANPNADLVFIAGLSRSGAGRQGIIGVDCDDAEAIGWASCLFGETPGKVRTRRGEHHLFNADGVDLGTLSSLRKYGVNVDLKHGRAGAAILAAPPSPHEKEPGFRYSWKGCDPYVLRHLPPFPAAKLFAFLEKQKPTALAKPRFDARGDSRGLWLNDQLVKHGPFFDGTGGELLNSALDKAHQLNESLAGLGLEPLDDSEVVRRSRQVVNDIENGKIERRLGRRATCTSDADEVRHLCSLPNGTDAFALLQLLRAEHAGKSHRGETFAICVNAMAQSGVLSSWGVHKYRKARDVLLGEGFIREVSPAQYRQAAQFELLARILTPSLASVPLSGTVPGGGRVDTLCSISESQSHGAPWVAEGIGRATWYRRKAKAGASAERSAA